MATVKLLSDDELSSEARAVFDDIRKTRQSDFVNNFWRALAHDPKTLRRTWESIKEVMAPGALEPKIKEMLYVAVSVAHGCNYCIHSHTAGARAKGMTEAEYREMIAIVGMAAETNRLVTALGVPIDDAFLVELRQDEHRNCNDSRVIKAGIACSSRAEIAACYVQFVPPRIAHFSPNCFQ